MRHRAMFCGLVAALAGCGPEAVDQAELGEVCGEAGPFRVLALAPDEQLKFEPPLQVGDRVLYVINKIGPSEPKGTFLPVVARTVWSTGPCGESPVQLATGVTQLFTVDAWPDVPLGCMENGDVVSLDPTGAREPHVVFEGVAPTFRCGLRWTAHGVLDVEQHDDELGALQLHPYPTDPYAETSTPVTLLDPVRLAPTGHDGSGYDHWTLAGFEDFVLALTADDSLVRVDLAAGAITTLQPGVWAFEASPAGTYVLWQSSTVTADDDLYPSGQVFLRETANGSDTLLAETSLLRSFVPMEWADQGLVSLTLGGASGGPTRLFRLPGLQSIEVADLPWPLLIRPADGERWLVTTLENTGIDMLDPAKGERRELFDRGKLFLFQETDAAVVLDVPQSRISGDVRLEGVVWRAPFDLSGPQKLAARATIYLQRLADGRIVSPVEMDAELVGALVVIDDETQQERRIDERVAALSIGTSWAGEEGILSYSVSDGERSGVYLARLAPRSSEREAAIASSADTGRVGGRLRGPVGRPVPQPRRAGRPPSDRVRGD